MKNLTIQHSLYPISPIELKEFEVLYTTWADVLTPLTVKIHNRDNALAAVLNCWVFIRHYPFITIPNMEQHFIHRCDYYFATLLNNSAEIAEMTQTWKEDADRLFIFSYYLALYFMRWVDFVLVEENAEIAAAIFKLGQKREYYLRTTEHLSPVSRKAIYLKQCLTTSLLTRDNAHFQRSEQIIKQSIQQTNSLVKQREVVYC
ncbi:hypothetical protein AAGS61_04840 [Lysinibacillus sp. KU-BSD001]|uniref:hypothetical protein n=1 Tax=Lysinibacillus sp. KU-BSD001 TaxID=3141328 RepID=UPI0036E1DA92